MTLTSHLKTVFQAWISLSCLLGYINNRPNKEKKEERKMKERTGNSIKVKKKVKIFQLLSLRCKNYTLGVLGRIMICLEFRQKNLNSRLYLVTSSCVTSLIAIFFWRVIHWMSFPGGSDGKESACNVGDLGLIPRLGRSPGGGHGNPLQYSCWRIPIDRGAWWVTVHRFAQSQTQLSD